MEIFYLLSGNTPSEKELVKIISNHFESTFDRKLRKKKMDENSLKGPTEKIGLDYYHWAYNKEHEIFISLFPNIGNDGRFFIQEHNEAWILRFYLSNNWADPNKSLLLVDNFVYNLDLEFQLIKPKKDL